MKKLFILCFVGLLISYLCLNTTRIYSLEESRKEVENASQNKIYTKEHPTKEEWFEVYLTHNIRKVTDLYALRIAVLVLIRSETNQIVVTLSSANGQDEISQDGKKIYCDQVESMAKLVLEEYEWAKNFKMTIQFP